MKLKLRSISLAVAAAFLAACAVNPVTGERQLIITSQSSDISTGEQYYLPSQQSQGGVYDVDPALTQYVNDVGARLAAQSTNPLPYEFVVLNNSVPNAWALPGGKIAINRGLLTELDNEAELAAVLGHEVVHAAARHSAQQQSRAAIGQVLVVATAVATSDSNYGKLATGGASVGTHLITSRYGRDAELESDLYGMRYMSAAGYDPTGAVTLQETFVRLSEGRQSDWLSGLFATHPPSQERVDRNRATAASLPAGGTLGADAFRLAMQQTMDSKPAYDAYDEGREALAEDRLDDALAHATRALELFNAEAHFHALRGDIRFVERRYDWAITNYTRAIDRRPTFFYYHLQRGIARYRLGVADAAETDLLNSIDMLPTGPAYFVLGQISADRGQTQQAADHFKVVLPVECGNTNNGTLAVRVSNKTTKSVKDVQVGVQTTDVYGRARVQAFTIEGPIAHGQAATLDTGLVSSASCPAAVIDAYSVD